MTLPVILFRQHQGKNRQSSLAAHPPFWKHCPWSPFPSWLCPHTGLHGTGFQLGHDAPVLLCCLGCSLVLGSKTILHFLWDVGRLCSNPQHPGPFLHTCCHVGPVLGQPNDLCMGRLHSTLCSSRHPVNSKSDGFLRRHNSTHIHLLFLRTLGFLLFYFEIFSESWMCAWYVCLLHQVGYWP